LVIERSPPEGPSQTSDVKRAIVQQALGLTISPALLAAAHEVIE